MLKFPVIKIFSVFVLGIIFQKIFQINEIFFLIAIPVLFLLFIFSQKLNFSEIAKSIFVLLIFLNSGAFLFQISVHSATKYPFEKAIIKKSEIFGKINNISLIREYEIRFEVSVDSIKYGNENKIITTKFLCRVRDENRSKLDSLYNKIEIGNIVSLKGTLAKGKEKRNPGEFDYQNYLNENGIAGIFTSYNSEDLQILSDESPGFSNFIFNIKKKIDFKIKEIYEPKTAGFLRGLLLADRSEIDYETKTDFINTGVVHILAVSGTHVAIILLIVAMFTGRFNVIVRSVISIFVIIIFYLLTGGAPSVTRASIMAIVLITAFLLNRKFSKNFVFNSLAIAGFTILLINPRDLFNPGFQLSFAAVISIAAIVPFLNSRIEELEIKNKYLKGILLYATVSIAAQIGTLPFTLYYFGKLSLVSILANVLIIPVIGIIIALGILSLILNPFLPFIASAYISLNETLVALIFSITKFFSGLKYSYITIRQFSILDAAIFYLFVFIFFFYFERSKNLIFRIALILLITINILNFVTLDDEEILKENLFYVAAIDVGQGDAILLKFPNGQTALIDAGNATEFIDSGERIILPLLDYLNIKKIDYAFISHVDSDHYAGFVSLIHNGKIKRIFKPQIDTSQNKDLKLEKYLREKRVPYSYFTSKTFQIGNAKLYFLNDKNINELKGNNSSGIIKIVYGKTSFLFTGDAEIPAEKYLIERYGNFLNSDFLKVGHHGSLTSTSEKFIEKVTPELSLISAGVENRYNHPAPKIIERLNSANSEIFRTDLEGAVILESDGNKIQKVNWREIK